MIGAALFLGVVNLILGGYVFARMPERLPEVGAHILSQSKLFLRIPLAIFGSTCLLALIPQERLGHLIGADSGARGILIASAFGAITPGGPMVTFPVALAIWQMGAGIAQLVAFLAAWSIFALHRILAYELPTMGPRFVLLRLSSAFFLPPLAGGLAALLMRII